MNRQSILQQEIADLDSSTILSRLKNDLNSFGRDFEKFSLCNISIANTDLPIDRKLLYSWRQHDLLPYDKEKGKNWGRFSFIEICWLKVMLELRKAGIGIDKLKEVKSYFFDKNFIKEYLSYQFFDLTNLPSDLNEELVKNGILKNNKIQVSSKFPKILEAKQFSRFSYLLNLTILTRSNYALVIDAEKKIEVYDLNKLLSDTITELPIIYDKLSDSTCVFVNIRKIVSELSNNQEIFRKTPAIASEMSANSVSALKHLFSENSVKEVTIRVNKNNQPIVLVTKEMELSELQKQVRSLNKKGTFKDIIVKTRDGNVQYFEQTEIFKL